MATRTIIMKLGDPVESLTESTSGSLLSGHIELTVSTDPIVTDAGSTRAIKRSEIYTSLKVLEQAVLKTLNIAD